MYCVSTVPYPAQITMPTALDQRTLAAATRSLFRTQGWAPWWLPGALGVHWNVRGAHRCPIAAADAAAVVALLRARPWGTPATTRQPRATLDRVARYAERHADNGPDASPGRDAAAVTDCATDC